MSRFNTQKFNGQEPSIHDEKDSDSPAHFFAADGSPSSIVELLTDPNEDAHWVRVRQEMIGDLSITGWMLRGHLGAPLEPPSITPVSEREFVQACVRRELAVSVGNSGHVIQADYLIALAWLESNGLKQLGPRNPQVDTIGPYQFSPQAWSGIAGTVNLAPEDRSHSLDQILAAAAVTQRDWDVFSGLAGPPGPPAPDGAVIPSFLNLFEAWLIGAPAAQEVDHSNATGSGSARIAPIIDKHSGGSSALITADPDYLQEGTVDGFIRVATEKLNSALKRAGELLVQHAPEFALPGGGTAAPWMKVAEDELKLWEANKLEESTAAAKERIRAYFAATDHGISDSAPWCGAFIAFCLKESGNERVINSVIPGAAIAANWSEWGDVALHASVSGDNGGLRTGAVVVLSPAADTGSSGHVTFFTGKMAGTDQIVGLGGNQSNRVKESNYPINRIVAVRFLDVGDADALSDEPVSKDMPDVERFRPMLDFIADHEGTADKPAGGYNTSLGNGEFIGGSEKNLIEMSLEQIDTLQTEMLDNPDNNLNSSALGRYQIVRTTLRRLKERLQLPDSTLYSASLQDQLGVMLIKGRGRNPDGLRNEWAGLKTASDGQILGAYDQIGA